MKTTVLRAQTLDNARKLVQQGYEPVACQFRDRRVPGRLDTDRTGASRQYAVLSLQHVGVRKDDPRFVTAGDVSPDTIFAVLAMAGELPHPAGISLDAMAHLIDTALDDPAAVELTKTPEGRIIVALSRLTPGGDETPSMQEACGNLLLLLGPDSPTDFIASAVADENARVRRALEAKYHQVSSDVAVIEGDETFDTGHGTDRYNYDVWFRHRAPVVIVHEPAGVATLVVRNARIVGDLFGEGGLAGVVGRLKPTGWNVATPDAALPPAGRTVTIDDALAAGRLVAEFIAARRGAA